MNIVNAKDRNTWVLVEFTTGKTIQISEREAETDKIGQANWDLGFSRTKIISICFLCIKQAINCSKDKSCNRICKYNSQHYLDAVLWSYWIGIRHLNCHLARGFVSGIPAF